MGEKPKKTGGETEAERLFPEPLPQRGTSVRHGRFLMNLHLEARLDQNATAQIPVGKMLQDRPGFRGDVTTVERLWRWRPRHRDREYDSTIATASTTVRPRGRSKPRAREHHIGVRSE